MTHAQHVDPSVPGVELTVTVAVLTYRRATLLAPLLEAVSASLDVGEDIAVDLLVVDNDPEASARPVVGAHRSAVPLRYVVETTPGIAAARQRVLDETSGRDLVVMLDDDVVPVSPWLEPLLSAWRRSRPAAVVGLLRYVYEAGTPAWAEQGRFFVRIPLPEDAQVQTAACGNILFDRRQVEERGVRFDSRLGTSGGEDTLFTTELTRRGGRIVACHDSVVQGFLPRARTTRAAAFARARGHGNVMVRVGVFLARTRAQAWRVRLRALVGGAARLLAGAVLWGWGVATRDPARDGRGFRLVARGFGLVEGAVGGRFTEYAR